LHPPYHDIIRFSERDGDLSRVPTESAFLEKIGLIAQNVYVLLKPAGFMALVIGDKYVNSQLVPLGFACMQRCIDAGFVLKAINVKEILNNERGKGRDISTRFSRQRRCRALLPLQFIRKVGGAAHVKSN
jgi:hypothetical protein